MDAVSYPQSNVIDFISSHFIPLRIAADHKELGPRFRVKWTPLIILLDSSGSEFHRTLGFFSPEELIPSLLLGKGKAHFNRSERTAAIQTFVELLNEYPKCGSAAEAIYLKGVANFIELQDVSYLKSLHKTLKQNFPQSTWTMRSRPYDLL